MCPESRELNDGLIAGNSKPQRGITPITPEMNLDFRASSYSKVGVNLYVIIDGLIVQSHPPNASEHLVKHVATVAGDVTAILSWHGGLSQFSVGHEWLIGFVLM